MRLGLSAFASGILILFVTSCGGGGGDSRTQTGSNMPGQSPTIPGLVTTLASVEAELVGATSLRVVEFMSLYDKRAAGSTLTVHTEKLGLAGAVFGLDTRGAVAIVGTASAGRTTLSSRSTIQTLVRAAVAAALTNRTADEIDNAAVRHPRFQPAVEAHRLAHSAGRNGLLDPSLLADIRQIATDLSSQGSSFFAGADRIRASALPTPRLDPPKAELFTLGSDPITLTFNPVDRTYVVENGTAASLTATQRDVSDIQVGSASLPPNGIARLSVISPAQSFSVTVQADANKNTVIFGINTLRMIVGAAGIPDKCVSSLAVDVLANEAATAFLANRTDQNLENWLRYVFANLRDNLIECASNATATILQAQIPIVGTVVRLVAFTYGLTGLLEHLDDWTAFEQAKSGGVCVNSSGIPIRCISQIRLGQPVPVLLVGSTAKLALEFVDTSGAAINTVFSPPADIKVLYPSGSEGEFASVDRSASNGSANVTAKKAGTQPVTILDLATDKQLDLLIEVDTPVLDVPEITVRQGATANAQVIGARTRLPLDGLQLVDVTTVNENVARARWFGDRGIVVEGLTLGTTEIVLFDLFSSRRFDAVRIPVHVLPKAQSASIGGMASPETTVLTDSGTCYNGTRETVTPNIPDPARPMLYHQLRGLPALVKDNGVWVESSKSGEMPIGALNLPAGQFTISLSPSGLLRSSFGTGWSWTTGDPNDLRSAPYTKNRVDVELLEEVDLNSGQWTLVRRDTSTVEWLFGGDIRIGCGFGSSGTLLYIAEYRFSGTRKITLQ